MASGGLIDPITYIDPRTLDSVSPPFWERSRKVRDGMGTVWPIALSLLAAATLGACWSSWRRRTARPTLSGPSRLQRRERDR